STSCAGAEDPNYTITYATGTLTVGRRAASLAYTGPVMVGTATATATSATVTVQALVTQAGFGGDLAYVAPVMFLFYKSTNLTMTTPDGACAGSVTSAGVASCSMPLGVDNWTVIVHEPTGNEPSANAYYTASN